MPFEIRFEPGLVPVLKHGSHRKPDPEPAVVKFAPGLTPVLKHPGHPNQKVHGRKGGEGASTGEPRTTSSPAKGSAGDTGMKVNSDGSFKYGELNFGPAEIEDRWASLAQSYGITDPVAWQAYVGAGRFIFWENNYATRAVSANMMGLPQSRARGSGGLSEGAAEMIRTGKYGNTGTFDEEAARPLIREGAAMLVATAKERWPDPLHRGIALKPDDPRLSAQSGDEFTMPISAFATRRQTAEDFATGALPGPEGESRGNRTPVLLTVQSGARAYATKNRDEDNGEEVVTQGRFRVERNTTTKHGITGEPMRLIVLRQTAYYDATFGEWVEAVYDD